MTDVRLENLLLGAEPLSLEPGERSVFDAVLRLHRLAEVKEPFERSFQELLQHSDSRLRAAAVRFFVVRGGADDGGCLLEATKHQELYREVAEPWHGGGHDLAVLLKMAIASRAATDERYLAFAKQTLVTPGDGFVGLRPVLLHDPEWVGSHVAEIVRGTPSALGSLGRLLVRRGVDVRELFRVASEVVERRDWLRAVESLPEGKFKAAVEDMDI